MDVTLISEKFPDITDRCIFPKTTELGSSGLMLPIGDRHLSYLSHWEPVGAMLKKREPEEVDLPKPGGIALGRRPKAIQSETSGSTSSEVVLFASSPFRKPNQGHTPSIAGPAVLAPPPRAADNGSAGTGDGGSAAAIAFLASLPAHLHAQVAADPLNTPVAKAHALLRLSPSNVTSDGFALQLSCFAEASGCHAAQ